MLVELDSIPIYGNAAMLSNCRHVEPLSLKFASDRLDTCGTCGSELMDFA